MEEWKQFYRIEPFGQPVVDFWVKQLLAKIHNIFAKNKVKPNDFSPSWQQIRKSFIKQKPEEIKSILMSIAIPKNKKKKRKK